MTNVVDPKAYWDLPETIWWICKRDEQWVTDMQDMSEEDKIALALFGIRPMTVVQPLKPPPPEIIAALQMMLAQENEKPARTTEAIVPGQALDDLLNKVRSGRVSDDRNQIRRGQRCANPSSARGAERAGVSVRNRPSGEGRIMVTIAPFSGLEFAAVFARRCDARMAGAKQENSGDHPCDLALSATDHDA